MRSPAFYSILALPFGVIGYMTYEGGIKDGLLVAGAFAACLIVPWMVYLVCAGIARIVRRVYGAARRGVKAWSDRCEADAARGRNPFRANTGDLSDRDIERIADALMKRKDDER